jgi:transmembrane sensor
MNRLRSTAETPADTAAAWLARHDRGLGAAEAGEFAAWRAADPRHGPEFDRLQAEWAGFDLAKADPALAAMARRLDEATRPAVRRRRHAVWAWTGGLAAAAALAVAWTGWWRTPGVTPAPAAPSYRVVPSLARTLTLADGSAVGLRGDSEVAVDFTPAERRVRLLRGEAHFTVAKNPDRPFVVSAGIVAVRAVGTAFNVRLDPATVEVLVTEGRVQVAAAPASPAAPAAGEPPLPEALTAPTLLAAGERVSVALAPAVEAPPVEVVPIRPAELEQLLAWQNTRLVFNRTPLGEAVEAFNRHGTHRLELGDPALGGRLLGGTFRADNAEGFVRLLEQSDGLRAEHRADGTIVLWPGR